MKKNRTARGEIKSEVEVPASRRDRVALLQQGLREMQGEVLRLMAEELLLAEVEELCGARYERVEARAGYRYGEQRGVMTAAGQRQPVNRPRVRTKDGKEVRLQSYELLNAPDAMGEASLKRMLRGVSTRNYSEVIETFQEGYGVSRSSVSLAFARGSTAELEKLLGRRFEGTRFAVIMLDGIDVQGATLVCALGIEESGTKRILGLREGATENAVVVTELLSDLRERGVDTTQPTLFVIDGGRALAKAVRDVWGDRAIIQRCRVHKKRNVRRHLPERHWPELDKRLALAWGAESYEQGAKSLQTTVKWLERLAPDAAKSLKEGMEETMTLVRLECPKELVPVLSTTNPIESAFSIAAEVTRRVKRWQDGSMRVRWCASGLLRAEAQFRRIRGCEQMPLLVKVLDAFSGSAVDRVKRAA
jgi:putative transposase